MSSMDSKRSKRRRNKRGSAKARQKVCNVSGVTNTNAVANSVNVDGDSFSHAQLSANLKKMPSSLSVSELDLDNIPQPLTQLPKSHNPYLDREHCLLCRRERPDPPRSSLNLTMGDEKEGDDQIPITPPMPLWLCPECRQNVEEEERNSKSFDASCMPQDVFVSSHLPLITSPLDGPIDLSAGDSINGPKSSEDPCSCMKCKEQRLIIAEEEKAKIKLAECWSELSHMVRCVYLEAGTALADDSSTKLCLPRIAELVQRLCAHDPHQLFLRLEIEVEDFVKEVKERLLKRLGEGYKSPQLAKQFMTMLMEEYTSLISASKTLSTVLEKLEKEHLSKFNLTWVLHNKHLFHSMVYLEPELHNKLGQLLKYLQQGSHKESYHSEESFSKLCQRYLKFSDEMTELSEGWREHQQLIESYVEKREISRTRELLAQQRTNWDFKFPPFPPSGDIKGHSSKCSHRSKECSHSGDAKQSVDHTPCNCRAKCSYQTNRNSHQNSLDYISLEDGLIPPQLAALDGYNYLHSIQPPNLSSPNSSQDDSEEIVPIFSRRCIDPGMCSPCSEDSIDSDDLTSESSQDATSQDAGYEEDDESESCNYNKKSRTTTTTTNNEKLSNGSNNTKGEPTYQTNQTCECHACITSAMQSDKLLPATAMATSTTDTSTTLSPNELRTQTAPYLFYSNLSNHQPLDLSHHGITAKHPLIHPHLYNLSSQKPTSSVQPQPFQFVDTPLHLSSEVNAYESAKMSLHSRGYDTDPDLLQSVKDALQTNCKLDKSGLLSSYVGKAHGKEHEEGGTGSPKLCNQSNRDSNVGLYNSAQFSVDAWAQQQLMAQLHQQQQHNGTIGPTTATNTHTSDCCPKHLGQSPRITNTAAKGHLFTHGTTATTTATLSATQQPLVQPISPLLQNLPTSDPQLFGTIKHGPSVDSSVSQSVNPSFPTPSHQHGQHQTTCKKKKGGDLEQRYQGCNLSCCMQGSDFGQDVHQQSVCALHNQHGITSSQGSAVDPVSLHTAGSTSTSASVCSDPDCDTHNFDDDLYPNSDDRSSSTTSSSRERDSKHCGCCYCEVFGHGGPALAPMSRNYPEIRDRLRLKLRERQQHPKDESPSHTHSPVSTNQTRTTAIPQNDLDTIVSFINGEKPKPKSNTSSKAAKRQRQKQRKAEQRAKQESQSKGSDCPSREQASEQCHNLSTQSTPTKSNKAKHNATHHSSTDEQPVSKTDTSNLHLNETQHTQAPGKLKGPEKKQAKPIEGEPTPFATNSSNKPLSAQKSTEDRRKEKRPKSAGCFAEVGESNRMKDVSQKKTDRKNESLAEKGTGNTKQAKKDSGKHLQDGQKATAQKGTDGPQQGLSNGHLKDSSMPSSKGASGGVQSSPATPRKIANKKESVKKEANAPLATDERKKPVQNGPIQNKPDAKETKQGNKLKGKNSQGDDNSKKPNGSSATSVKSGSKKKDVVLENGFMEGKNHVIGKQPNNHKKPELMVKATTKVNGIIERENHRMDLPVGNATSNAINTNSKKKKKKKGGENTNSLMIDEIFLPKENVDMNEMDEVEQELEAFKRFCMDSTPQRKKEKVVFNVKDIILNAKKTSAH